MPLTDSTNPQGTLTEPRTELAAEQVERVAGP
jgi:hypothetical protein